MPAPLFGEGLLTKDQLEAIGHVAIESSHLETLVGNYLCFTLGLNLTARSMLLDRLGLTAKLNNLKIVVMMRLRNDEAASKRFSDIIESFRTSIDERNRLIHGTWYQVEKPPGTFTPVAYKGHDFTDTISAEKAIGTARALAEFQAELEAFFLLHGDELVSIP